MNFGNFDEKSGENKDNISSFGDFPPPAPKTPPEKLSTAAKAALTVGTTFFMIMCGVWNYLGTVFDDAVVFMGAGMLSMLVYIILGGACALICLDSPRLALVPPSVSVVSVFAISAAVSGLGASLVPNALMSLFPFVGGLIIAVSMKKGAKRSGAILAAALGLAVFCVAVLLLNLFIWDISLRDIDLIAIIDSARKSFIEAMELRMGEMAELYGSEISDIDIEGAVNGVFNLLPSMLILTFASAAFFSQLSLLALCRIFGLYHKLEKKDTEFEVTAVTAIVFALSEVLALVFAARDSVYLAVFNNLSTILLPALAVVGLMSVLPKKEGNMVKVGCFPLMLFVSLVFFATDLAILFLAVVGTVDTLKKNFKSSKKG